MSEEALGRLYDIPIRKVSLARDGRHVTSMVPVFS